MAEIIRADGTREAVEPDQTDGTFSGEFLRKIVGGWIEIVSLGPARKRMIVDDEGRLKGKPWNAQATTLYWENTLPNTNKIHGDVVVIDWDEIQ